MRPPIHSQKHYVQYPIDEIAAGTTQFILLAEGVESTVANLATEVAEGSVIKAVYIELWLQNQGNLSEQVVTVSKDQQGGVGPAFSNHANLNAYTGKKNILFTHQGLGANDAVSGPQFILKHWIKIPKGKQRFGLGDKLNLNISNVSSNGLNRCGFSIYKEYS